MCCRSFKILNFVTTLVPRENLCKELIPQPEIYYTKMFIFMGVFRNVRENLQYLRIGT